jgi:hypothetical protein
MRLEIKAGRLTGGRKMTLTPVFKGLNILFPWHKISDFPDTSVLN